MDDEEPSSMAVKRCRSLDDSDPEAKRIAKRTRTEVDIESSQNVRVDQEEDLIMAGDIDAIDAVNGLLDASQILNQSDNKTDVCDDSTCIREEYLNMQIDDFVEPDELDSEISL